jgi:hypothetical protein
MTNNQNGNEQELRHAEARADPRYTEARDILFTAMSRADISKSTTEVSSYGGITKDDNTKAFLFEIVVNEIITYGQLKELDRNGAQFSLMKPEQNGTMALMVWVYLK